MEYSTAVEELGPAEHRHPGAGTYVPIAIILAVITVIEVAIYYIQWMHDTGLIVPALLLLSFCKFVLVVGYFMHLKFDHRLFTYTFVFGLLVGVAIVLALIVIFHFHFVQYTTKMIGG